MMDSPGLREERESSLVVGNHRPISFHVFATAIASHPIPIIPSKLTHPNSPLIINPRLMLHHIKSRLTAKPPRRLTPHRRVRPLRILLINLDRLAPLPSRSRISHQLRMTALLQTHVPEDAALDRGAAGQQPMVLEESGFLVAECGGDGTAFVGGEHDAAEGRVGCDVVVEGAGVLGYDVEAGYLISVPHSALPLFLNEVGEVEGDLTGFQASKKLVRRWSANELRSLSLDVLSGLRGGSCRRLCLAHGLVRRRRLCLLR